MFSVCEYTVSILNHLLFGRNGGLGAKIIPSTMNAVNEFPNTHSKLRCSHFNVIFQLHAFKAKHEEEFVGAIVCKLDLHKKISRRGYIAMLAVDKSVRRRNIGKLTHNLNLCFVAQSSQGLHTVTN